MEVALTLVTSHHVYSSYSSSLPLLSLAPSSRHLVTWACAMPSSNGRGQLQTGHVCVLALLAESRVEPASAPWVNRIWRLFTLSKTCKK